MMDATSVLFYIFSTILVLSALKVVTARNPVVSVLFLVLAFFNAAIIWLLLQAEFLAILLVLVYAGAVMVLFLFVVMMFDLKKDVVVPDYPKFAPLATFVGIIIILEMALVIWKGYGATISSVAPMSEHISNTRLIGQVMYGDYIFAFEIAGLILLVAVVAAVGLTINRVKDRKRQVVSEQIRVRREDRIRIVSMKAEMPDNQTTLGNDQNAQSSTRS